jgi:hypothetical protein
MALPSRFAAHVDRDHAPAVEIMDFPFDVDSLILQAQLKSAL